MRRQPLDFLELLKSKQIVLLDGAIGTELDKHGLMGRGSVNLDAPDVVGEIHRAYAKSGSQVLTTNTLTMNRIYIETHNVQVAVREVNRAGAELARSAAGDGRYVLGDIGSTGQLLEPYGTFTESQFHDTFKEQAESLAEAGVDGFIVETMFDLREALCALRACKESSSLPVLVSIAFSTEAKGGRTIMGDTAEQVACRLGDAGADVIGANCGDLDPSQMAKVVALLGQATNLPLLAQPNAGRPKLIGDQAVFDMEPIQYAEGVAQCIQAGAQVVGGCCGTTPNHIRAVSEMIESLQCRGKHDPVQE
jgi:5-methyltetrahydrofolate--homocysteine methyltransferase